MTTCSSVPEGALGLAGDLPVETGLPLGSSSAVPAEAVLAAVAKLFGAMRCSARPHFPLSAIRGESPVFGREDSNA
jgi:hypothetical protein